MEKRREDTWKRNIINYNDNDNNNCRFIYARNMILLLANVSIYKIMCFFPVYNLVDTIKPYYNIIEISYLVQWQSHITVYTNKYQIDKKVQFNFLLFSLVKFIIVVNTLHIRSDRPIDIICR